MAFFYRSTDRKAYERELQRLANEGGGGADRFIKPEFPVFRPKSGTNTIRILPCSWDRKPYPHWSLRISKHDGIGPSKRSAVICPYHTDRMHERCPICEDVQRLLTKGRLPENTDAKAAAARHRSLIWVIDRNQEEKGPQVWDIYQGTETTELLGLMRDVDTGETIYIDHPEEGRDIVFDRTGEGLNTKYVSYRLKGRSSLVAPEHLDFIERHPLPSVLIWRNYDEIKAIYTGVGPENDTRQRDLDLGDPGPSDMEPAGSSSGGFPDDDDLPFDREEDAAPPPATRSGRERAAEILRRRQQKH